MASNAFKKFKTTSNQHTTQWVKCLQRHCAPQPPDPVSSQNPMGLHVPEGCCWSQDGYLKPRLAGQSALATPHSYYSFPCKAIYVVWQHNSYKQNEYIDSWIVKGSGLIFFSFLKWFLWIHLSFLQHPDPSPTTECSCSTARFSTSSLHCKQLHLAHA